MNSSKTNRQPTLAVGLLQSPEVEIHLVKGFAKHEVFRYTARELKQSLRFDPIGNSSIFEVRNVMIGVGFHWQQLETQRFRGSVELLPADGSIIVINHVAVEDYLTSVISSEMSATAPEDFLKAHAVISRSWVLRQIGRSSLPAASKVVTDGNAAEIIRWYDREDHTHFDVCADDHCQRYQGIGRQSTPAVESAIAATRGIVLMNGNEVCDARFSKCCGGITEEFGTCWGDEEHPYLIAKRDDAPTGISHNGSAKAIYDHNDNTDNCDKIDINDRSSLPDTTAEAGARQWIMSRPEAFCNTSDSTLLSSVLNNYDQSTTDFYRWKVTATGTELASLIAKKTGIDLGIVRDLIPLQRGKSGRIYRLRITGTKSTLTVGKELEIRRILSPSHLYSSAFAVTKVDDGDDAVFILDGAGWGHGVGLCQIGAAAMASKGYAWNEILNHYYPGSSLVKIYE